MYPLYQPVPTPMVRTATNPAFQPMTQSYTNLQTPVSYQPVTSPPAQQPLVQQYQTVPAQVTVQTVKEPESLWRKKYPFLISSLFTIFQGITSIIIIGCEIGSMLIDIVTATIYVGIWAGIFFLIATISASVSLCCSREHGYALYNLVNQCIALVFSLCVIAFDSYFIANSQACFFPKDVCQRTDSSRGLYYSTANFDNVKSPLIKGQLAAGCVMFVLCLFAIALYGITFFRVNRGKMATAIHPTNQQSTMNPNTTAGTSNSMQSYAMVPPNSVPHSSTELNCPGCNSKMIMGTHKQLHSHPIT